jgi:hypothetical protein
MKSYLIILPYGLLILAQSAYDNHAPLDNTNWSILYFGSFYLTLFILSIRDANKIKNKIKRLPIYTLSVGFAYMVYRNLSKINMPYQEFKVSVNDYEANLLFSLFIIISFCMILGQLYGLFIWVVKKFLKRG